MSALQVDVEMAEKLQQQQLNAGKNAEADPDLNKVLPKLAQRMNTSGGSTSEKTPVNPPIPPPVDSNVSPGGSLSVKEPTPASGRQMKSFGATIRLKASQGLPEELERLRTQDIQPDENSAAMIALRGKKKDGVAVAAAAAAAASAAEGGAAGAEESPAQQQSQVKRRTSLSRQMSGRPSKNTHRKVEGREIQQGHSQYALTYGLMLGIRVMTGRKDSYSSTGGTGGTGTSSSSPPAGGLVRNANSTLSVESVSSVKTMGEPPSPGGAAGGGGGGGDRGSGRESGSRTNSGHFFAWESERAQAMLQERSLTIEDFGESLELKFKPEGSADGAVPTPPHKLGFSFKFKDYMPNVFRAVRGMSNISEADYMMDLAGDFNYIEFIANSKSGQFFFYSHDGRYMIKTQSKEECILLRQIMPRYVEHLHECPDSLLVRFYGMHRVKFKSGKKIYFVIMSSVFNTDKHIDIKYDLKGSLAGRITKPKACAQGAVQKDLNLKESGRKFRFGEENIDVFSNTLRADVKLLEELNIMDYSLLVGVHDKDKEKERLAAAGGAEGGGGVRGSLAPRRGSGVVLAQRPSVMLPTATPPAASSGAGAVDVGGSGGEDELAPASVFQSYYGGIPAARGVDEIYFMGIIDILQLYNIGKQTESFYKGIISDRMLQSAVNPKLYAQRMLDFIIDQHSDYPEIMQQRAADKKEHDEQRKEML
mmetsp:Transcript_23038/g.38584  ORF Transcript_23038/g.38584 Transcript_23038/m.38584 type:complete len:705 (-) Transcript_23038:220-2334(-)